MAVAVTRRKRECSLLPIGSDTNIEREGMVDARYEMALHTHDVDGWLSPELPVSELE
jgi:hypothetical protein